MTTSDIIDRLDTIRFQLTFDGPRGVTTAIEKLTRDIRRDGLKADLLIGGDCVTLSYAERKNKLDAASLDRRFGVVHSPEPA